MEWTWQDKEKNRIEISPGTSVSISRGSTSSEKGEDLLQPETRQEST